MQDPPFSRLDLISCRNLLIYLEPEIQKRVLALFHFALREGGYLFLGPAETITGQEELFRADLQEMARSIAGSGRRATTWSTSRSSRRLNPGATDQTPTRPQLRARAPP